MSKSNKHTQEEILLRALEYIDNGKSHEEILRLLPHNHNILRDIFAVVKLLRKEGMLIHPAPELLDHILRQVSPNVTIK